jgi:hypothetical protein
MLKDLSKLNIPAESGTMTISLVYNNVTITNVSKDISVVNEIENQTENQTVLNQTSNLSKFFPQV